MRADDPYRQEDVRKGALHYLLGRGAAGVAGLAIVLLLVRFMDIANYAAYTALSGLVAVCGIVAGLGMERVVSRYVPEGRLHRRIGELRRFIWNISLMRLTACFVVGAALWLCWPQLSRMLAVSQYGAFAPCLAFFIVAETMFQHFSAVLQALVLQKTLTRLLVIQWGGRLLVLAAALMVNPVLGWEQVFWLFTVPELLGVLAFAVVVHRHLREVELGTQPRVEAVGDWPDWGRVGSVGWHNFGFTLLAAPPQGYFMKMITAAFLPAEVVAAYGFFISLAEKVRQYIPMHFFYGLLEPVMIASYLKDGDFEALSARCGLLYKTNLLLMALVIACAAASGESTLAVMAGGKFGDLSWILPLVLVQLTFGSHVVLLQLLLNSIERSQNLIRATVLALPVTLAAMAVAAYAGPIGLLFTPLLFSLCMNSYIVFRLRRGRFVYRPDWKMIFGISFAALAAFVPGWALAKAWATGAPLLVLVAVCLLVTLLYALALILLNVIKKSELAMLKSLLINKKF
ncbi:MAG TPA: hypothetical protein VF472_25720 [Burkholderiaceae bacterium]